MTALITEGTGQLKTELSKLLDEKQVKYISMGSKYLDITNIETEC